MRVTAVRVARVAMESSLISTPSTPTRTSINISIILIPMPRLNNNNNNSCYKLLFSIPCNIQLICNISSMRRGMNTVLPLIIIMRMSLIIIITWNILIILLLLLFLVLLLISMIFSILISMIILLCISFELLFITPTLMPIMEALPCSEQLTAVHTYLLFYHFIMSIMEKHIILITCIMNIMNHSMMLELLFIDHDQSSSIMSTMRRYRQRLRTMTSRSVHHSQDLDHHS